MSLRLQTFILAVAWAVLLDVSCSHAATNALPVAPRLGSRTNLPPSLRLNIQTNPPVGPARTGAKTNLNTAAPGAKQGTGKSGSRLLEEFRKVQTNRAFYPVVAGVAVLLGALLLYRAFKPKTTKPGDEAGLASGSRSGAKLAASQARRKTVYSCNVLEVSPKARQVWQFEARGGGFALSRQQTCLEGEALPAKLVSKDWRALFQAKLNVAWLPPENVFLRVIQLPKSDFGETLSMVELQLEKLSPIPVAQAAWSLHVMPHTDGDLQTVVVVIVARSVVEEFLGGLEGQGYLADRLEVPALDQLQATAITGDGAWIYPDVAAGKNTAVVAWWYGGTLRNLDLVTLPATNRGEGLKEQLLQMAWAGELEGWLTSPPEWHLVADVARPDWEPALREGLEQPIETISPLATGQVAALTAKRSSLAEPRANLLPAEFTTRYHQQFVDRLWMRSLVAVGAVYLLYVLVQMSRLGYATYLTNQAEAQATQLSPAFTNAIQLRDRYKVLKDREELKYAALDCWSTTASLLPENVTLDSFTFSEGKRLNLSGSAPSDQTQKLLDFDRDLRRASNNGVALFNANSGDNIIWRVQGPTATWSLSLELNRSELQ